LSTGNKLNRIAKAWSQTPKAVPIFGKLGVEIPICCYQISRNLSGAAQVGRYSRHDVA
jgi:hypothetical protein